MREEIFQNNLAAYLDLANHHPEAGEEEIKKLCRRVLRYGFNAAFVNPYFLPLAHQLLGGKGKVGTVISFPLGGDLLKVKREAAKKAVSAGAEELDISLNISFLKERRWKKSFEEMKAIVEAVKEKSSKTVIKFIPETGYLDSYEIKKAAELILRCGADFIKTCSGFGPRGATLKDVFLIKQAVGEKLKIKVAGGIKTRRQALSFLKEGVARIGSSHAVEILKGGGE